MSTAMLATPPMAVLAKPMSRAATASSARAASVIASSCAAGWPRRISSHHDALVGSLQDAACGGGGAGQSLADRLGSMLVGEDLDAPWAVPPGLAQGADHAREVKDAFTAVAAAVHGVLEQGSDDVRVGVVELHADDAVQRDVRELGGRRLRARDVPRVDDDATCRVSGIDDEPQTVAQRLDVGPGEELQAQ